MLKLIMTLIWLILIPTCLGMLYTYFNKKEKNNIILIFVSGYIIELAVFELLAVPMTFLECAFTTLLYTFAIITGILSILSLILNRKNLKELVVENVKVIKNLPLTTILVVILIILQTFIVFRYMHVDDDDAFSVGNATTSIETNTISKYNPTKGYEWGWQPRYVLAPFSIWIAVLSELIGFHPAAVAHTIFPVLFIPMVYMIFGLIANELFNKDKKKTMLFLLVLNFLYMFGNYSKRTSFSVLFLRIWQGKAFLANIIIPLIWYLVLKNMKEDKHISDFIMMILVMTSACLVSSMGVPLAPIILMSMILVYAIRDKKISYLFKYLIPCIPCVICGVIYLMLTYL